MPAWPKGFGDRRLGESPLRAGWRAIWKGPTDGRVVVCRYPEDMISIEDLSHG